MPPRLVLVGAGHPQLFLLEGLARMPTPPSITWVTPHRDKVFGPLVPAVLAGKMPLAAARVDLVRLADAAGARLVDATVTTVDPDARTVTLGDGATLEYDLLSIACGARPAGLDLPGVAEWARPVCSYSDIERIHQELTGLERRGSAAPPRLVVAGSGPWCADLALAMLSRLEEAGVPAAVLTLEPDLPADRPQSRTTRFLDRALDEKGVLRIFGAMVQEVNDGAIRLSNGARVAFDLLLWTQPIEPGSLARRSGLPVDGRGFLLVDPHLRSTGARNIFVSGGAAALAGDPYPPAPGQPDLRHGPVLKSNLLATLAGQSPPRRIIHRRDAGPADDSGRRIFPWREPTWTGILARHLGTKQARRMVQRFQDIHREIARKH